MPAKEEKPTLPDIPLPNLTDTKFDALAQQHISPGQLNTTCTK
jgi:hypothetical protein